MGGKSGTTTQSVAIPKEVLARYNAVNSQAQSVAATPFQKYSTNPNDFVAGINQQQYAGIGGINQAANMAQPSIAYAQQGLTGQGYQQGVQQYMNPYLQNAMGSTAAQMQNVNQQQQNQLAGNAIQQGAFGGDRAGIARNNLINQQNLAMGQTLGQMANQGYQQSAQNYMQGMGQIGQLGLQGQQAALQGAQAQLGAGTLEQQTQQAGQTALYNQFLQQQAYPFQVAQFLANIAMGTGGLSGSTTTTTQPMPFFSDRRLKKNIERIGQTDDGLPIHKFEYKGDKSGQKHIGLMADEVEQVHPDAVGLHPSGYKVVDYDKATSEGGAVTPQRAGLGFAAGGDVAAGLNAMNAMQANMPVAGGGVNTGLAAAAQAIAPQPNVPQSVFYEPSYNVFADPKYQPDLSGANAAAAAGDGKGGETHGRHSGAEQMRQRTGGGNDNRSNPFGSNSVSVDPNGAMYDSSGRPTGGYDPTQGPAYANGGRTHFESGGYSVNDPYDPYSIKNILANHMDMYNQLERHAVPTGRSLAGGMGKHGRVPEASLAVSQLKTAGPAPSLPDSMLKQAVSSGTEMADLGTRGREFYDWLRNKNAADAAAAGNQTKTPEESRGGLVGFAAGGSAIGQTTPDPTDEIYGQENTDSTKRNIPTKFDKTKLQDPSKPPGMTSQTGLSLGEAASLAKTAGQFILPFFLKDGGRAGYAPGGSPTEGISEKLLPIMADFQKEYPEFQITSGYRSPEHNARVGGVGGSQHLHGNAFDFSVKGVPEDRQIAATNWLRERGIGGLGYYPDSQSMHADVGGVRHWGPDKTSKSLGATPAWFQKMAGYNADADLPARGASPAQGASAEKKEGLAGMLPSEMTDSKYIVPLLTGLGAMASSNSPYFGSALLQGLGAGAQSYVDTQRKKAAIDQTLAETRAIEAETEKGAIFNTPMGTGVWILAPDGKTRIPISFMEYQKKIRNGEYPKTAWAQPIKQGEAPEGFQIPEGGSGAPAEGGAATGAPAAGQPPEAGANPAMRADIYDDSSRAAAQRDMDAVSQFNPSSQANFNRSNQYIQKVSDLAQVARDDMQNVKEMSSNLAKSLTLGGAAVPGIGFDMRARAFAILNAIAAANGQPRLTEADAISEITKKVNGLKTFAQSAGYDQNSYAALQQAAETVPSPNMSPDAFIPMTAMMMVKNRRDIEAKNHADRWGQDSGQIYLGAGADFSRKTSQRWMDDQNALTGFMKLNPKEFRQFMNGVDVNGNPIDEARMQNVFKALGMSPRLSKYFAYGD